MRLESVAVALPSRTVSNAELVDLIREQSEQTFDGDLDVVIGEISTLLRRAGAESRCWLGPGESVLSLTANAVRDALELAECRAQDIQLLIYTSIDRGFVDPANAYLIAKALEMEDVQCFDVVDACNGWSRAVQLTNALLHAEEYDRVLLVSPEFPLFEGGPVNPHLFRLATIEDVRYSFAGFTLGEGVAATVLSRDPGREWDFRFSSRPSLADLCSVPLPGYERYGSPSGQPARNGAERLTAFSAPMFAAARREIPPLVESFGDVVNEVSMIFPHAAALGAWAEGRDELEIDAPIYNVFPRCGNLGSASVPAGIALATAEGRVDRGDRLLCVTASAGMSFAAYSFVY